MFPLWAALFSLCGQSTRLTKDTNEHVQKAEGRYDHKANEHLGCAPCGSFKFEAERSGPYIQEAIDNNDLIDSNIIDEVDEVDNEEEIIPATEVLPEVDIEASIVEEEPAIEEEPIIIE